MLLLAIPSIWPYGYYQLLRWIISGVALFNAYTAHQKRRKGWFLVMLGVAILFNPITPFSFEKVTWVMVDIITAGVMIIFSKKDIGLPK